MSEKIRSTIQKKDASGQIRHGGEWLALWSDPKSMQSEVDRQAAARADQEQSQIHGAIAASVRSVSADTSVDVLFSRDVENGGEGLVVLPALADRKEDVDAIRGAGDAAASFLRHHRKDVHKWHRPEDEDSAQIFDLLERARCEGLIARSMPGVAANLVAWHLKSLRLRDLMNAHLASLIPLADGLQMVLRDTFTNAAEASIQTAGMRMWDTWLRRHFGESFVQLSACLEDQNTYAAEANSFLALLFAELPSKGKGRERRNLTPRDGREGEADPDAELLDDDLENIVLFDPGDDEDLTGDMRHELVTSAIVSSPYRIYTDKHDRIMRAEELFDKAALDKSRHRLDKKQAQYRQEVMRLSGRLQRRLMALKARHWEFELDEGLIDASRLDRIVTTPGYGAIYKQEAQSPFKDTLVTLLIDNSGSMRGKPVETACVVADILSAALERCDVATEILGFTTRAWKGGSSAKEWKQSGRPSNPGRLNDLLHIVYKDVSTPLRRARNSICAMLEPSLLKENIDGEALYWAAERMLARPEKRRLLIVISDGAPVDQSTLEANGDKALLDRHLRDVIAWIGSSTPIDLAAIGIKHDVGAYYANAVRIDDVAELGAAVIDLLDERLTGRGEH